MQTLYKVGFHLKPLQGSTDEVLDPLIKIHADWLRKSNNGPKEDLLKLIAFGSEEPTWEKNGVCVRSWSFEDSDRQAWAMRFSHPDHSNPAWQWITEATFCEIDKKCAYGFSLGVQRMDGVLEPFTIQPKRPNLINTILSTFHCGDRFALKPTAHGVRDEETKVLNFINFLESDERLMPVLFISAENATNRPMIDYNVTADVLGGLAHVLVAENASVTARMRHHIPFNLNCFNGYIRLYWPNFKESDPSYRHPYWDRRELTLARVRHDREPGQLVLNAILEAALFRELDGVIQISDIENWQHFDRMKQAKAELLEAGKESEYIALMEEENQRLLTENTQLHQELKKEESTRASLRAQVDSLTYVIEHGGEDAKAAQAVRDPQTVDEALALAESECQNIVFAFNSKSEEKAYPFERAEDVFWALEWLNTVYFDSKTGKKSCPNLDVSIRETVSGWSFSPNQSDYSLKANKEWYECTWEGRKYTIEEHFRCGIGTRPEHCIRIAFAWDRQREKVVVGYLGQHQRNTKS